MINMRLNKKLTLSNNQDGLVSIIVTMILLIVLTLIVISFARMARREQRQTLDRQLSTQAYYAAESGVNDFSSAFDNGDIDISTEPNRTDCADTWPSAPSINPNIAPGVEYTCVLYDSEPPMLEYSAVPTDRMTIFPVNNTDLTRLSISWQGSEDTAGANFRSTPTGQFTPQGSWNSDTGVLRIMIIPRADPNLLNIRTGTFTSFLYPEQTGTSGAKGAIDYSAVAGRIPDPNLSFNNSGRIGSGFCNISSAPLACNVDITNLKYGSAGYLVVMRSIYTPSNVRIEGFNAAGPTSLTGAQVMLDATGKAQDVIRRIQVRLPITVQAEGLLPAGFTSIENLCKQIELAPPIIIDRAPGSCSLN